MKSNANNTIFKFYNKKGWLVDKKNLTTDSRLFEDNRKCAKNYVSKCRLRVNNFINNRKGKILDFASGPLQYKEYLSYSKGFSRRYCVDFSKSAIYLAKKKLKKKGKYFCKDYLSIKFGKNYFDCAISLHTLYHIKKNKQKKVVEKLIYETKRKSPIIIVYSNPNTIISKISKIFKKKKIKRLYFYCYPNEWWYQFKKIASVEIKPWRSFSSQHQKLLFPDNIFGKIMFNLLFSLENFLPNFFVNFFQYQIIIIKKN